MTIIRTFSSLAILLLVGACADSSERTTAGDVPSGGSPSRASQGTGIAPSPIISRGLPVYASHNAGSASNLTDGSFTTSWSSGGTVPCWAAINVGTGPSRLIVYWQNETWAVYRYADSTLVDYAVQVSADSTNGSDGSWTDVANVTGNEFGSREHAFDFTGYSWVRLYITHWTTSRGGLHVFDVHDASAGTQDTMFFYGDSISQAAYRRQRQPDYAANVHTSVPTHTPLMIGGGIGGTTAANWGAEVGTLVNELPDVQYWLIAFGMNDSWGDATGDPNRVATFKSRMELIVTTLLGAGRTPILAQITYATPESSHGGIPAYNVALRELETQYDLIPGPDLYTHFLNHPEQLSDGVHPTSEGVDALNLLWAQHMLPLYAPSASLTISDGTILEGDGSGTTATIEVQLSTD